MVTESTIKLSANATDVPNPITNATATNNFFIIVGFYC